MSLAADMNPQERKTHLAHHFDSLEQQYNSAKLGMWLFLVTEILLFSGLFMAYIVYRYLNPELFVSASNMLSLGAGATNTVVLIGSSLTMALAVRAAQLNNKRQLVGMLVATLTLASVFMVIKGFEYSAKFQHGIFPGRWFHPHGDYAEIANLDYARTFFSIYFMMTGLHGFHVLIGMAVITWVLIRATRGHFSSRYYVPVEIVGLYWHLVDLIWIYLFPLLYLVDRTGAHG